MNYRLAIALLLGTLCGCAQVPFDPLAPSPRDTDLQVAWHERSLPELVQICNHGLVDVDPHLKGCYRQVGNTCHIFTLPRWVAVERDALHDWHSDAGHELDHCAHGDFHGQTRGVSMPRLPERPVHF